MIYYEDVNWISITKEGIYVNDLPSAFNDFIDDNGEVLMTLVRTLNIK